MEQRIEAKKILVRAPNWVGDVVMATPAFRCIRENFADSHITLLIKKNLRGIIDGSSWFDDVIELETKAGKSTKDFLRLIYKLRQESFDLGFLFPNSFSSALMVWLSGISRRIGYRRDARSLLLTDGIERLSENEQNEWGQTLISDYALDLIGTVVPILHLLFHCPPITACRATSRIRTCNTFHNHKSRFDPFYFPLYSIYYNQENLKSVYIRRGEN